MMNPIHIRINKKTKVPTKNNLVHQYRFDWKTVGVVSYNQTPQLFKAIGGGPVETDAQFAKWLRDRFGVGTYSVIAWRKGRGGFWGFIKVECGVSTFRRLKKSKSPERKEKEVLVQKYHDMKSQVDMIDDDEERSDRLQKLTQIERDLSVSKELVEAEKSLKYGPGFYLKATKPVYGEHLYDSQGVVSQIQEESVSLW